MKRRSKRVIIFRVLMRAEMFRQPCHGLFSMPTICHFYLFAGWPPARRMPNMLICFPDVRDEESRAISPSFDRDARPRGYKTAAMPPRPALFVYFVGIFAMTANFDGVVHGFIIRAAPPHEEDFMRCHFYFPPRHFQRLIPTRLSRSSRPTVEGEQS